MLAGIGAANGRSSTAAGDEELVAVAGAVVALWLHHDHGVELQLELAHVARVLVDGQLARAGAVVRRRIVRIGEVRVVVGRRLAARIRNCINVRHMFFVMSNYVKLKSN